MQELTEFPIEARPSPALEAAIAAQSKPGPKVGDRYYPGRWEIAGEQIVNEYVCCVPSDLSVRKVLVTLNWMVWLRDSGLEPYWTVAAVQDRSKL